MGMEKNENLTRNVYNFFLRQREFIKIIGLFKT